MVHMGDIQAVPSGRPGRGYLGFVSSPPVELPDGIKGRALYYELRLLTDDYVPGARVSGPIRLVPASDDSQKNGQNNKDGKSARAAIQADGRSPLAPQTASVLQRILQEEQESPTSLDAFWAKDDKNEDGKTEDDKNKVSLIERLAKVVQAQAQALSRQGIPASGLLTLFA